jgi:hypothetical protein
LSPFKHFFSCPWHNQPWSAMCRQTYLQLLTSSSNSSNKQDWIFICVTQLCWGPDYKNEDTIIHKCAKLKVERLKSSVHLNMHTRASAHAHTHAHESMCINTHSWTS